MSKVRIVSDGEPYGTRVYVGDNEIDGVLEVHWSAGRPGDPALVSVTLKGAEIDVRVLPENAQIVQAEIADGEVAKGRRKAGNPAP